MQEVDFRNCHYEDGKSCAPFITSADCWCETKVGPVLMNDEALKNHIMTLENEPVWIKVSH